MSPFLAASSRSAPESIIKEGIASGAAAEVEVNDAIKLAGPSSALIRTLIVKPS